MSSRYIDYLEITASTIVAACRPLPLTEGSEVAR